MSAMLAKLALRNVRRSVRDYAIYFVTLVFGVAIFYAFNSIGSQQILFNLESETSARMFEFTTEMLGMFSVVIACVLGFLVVYANRFLIRRRKQEFGTYLMLGMNSGSVSAIILMETALVGAVSLAVGLALGLALSQALSFLTAALFSITMSQYQFVFSPDACGQTLLCFVVIFVVVALFNTLSIRRQKLITLLSTHGTNERFRVRNPFISFVGFVLAVGILALAYYTLITNGLTAFDAAFQRATALMLIGTFLFFWSVAGFVLAVLERTRGVYFRGLAMFTMRQIASKVNTAFLSLSVVCVLLFFALTVSSVGAGMVQVFSGDVEECTQFDASLYSYTYLAAEDAPAKASTWAKVQAESPDEAAELTAKWHAEYEEMVAAAEPYGWSIAAFMEANAPGWRDFVAQTWQIDSYQPSENTTTYGEIMDRYGVTIGIDAQDESVRVQTLTVVGVSQFNAVREQYGRDPIDVGDAGYAVNNTLDAGSQLSAALATEGLQVQVGGIALTATGEVVDQMVKTAAMADDSAVLIVPDRVIDSLRAQGKAPYTCYLNINYREGVSRAEGDKLLDEALATALPAEKDNGYGYNSSAWPVTNSLTANEAIEQASGMRMAITYLALYIGFIFLIATAALLAVQQLSETSDSLQRYRVLAQLGCDRRMVLGSLRAQTCLYFLAPLLPAVCHTVCAVGVIGDEIFEQFGVSVAGPALITAALTVVVYGSYLLITYFAARGIIRGFLGKKLLG